MCPESVRACEQLLVAQEGFGSAQVLAHTPRAAFTEAYLRSLSLSPSPSPSLQSQEDEQQAGQHIQHSQQGKLGLGVRHELLWLHRSLRR